MSSLSWGSIEAPGCRETAVFLDCCAQLKKKYCNFTERLTRKLLVSCHGHFSIRKKMAKPFSGDWKRGQFWGAVSVLEFPCIPAQTDPKNLVSFFLNLVKSNPNQIVFTIFQWICSEKNVHLVPNQSENSKFQHTLPQIGPSLKRPSHFVPSPKNVRNMKRVICRQSRIRNLCGFLLTISRMR